MKIRSLASSLNRAQEWTSDRLSISVDGSSAGHRRLRRAILCAVIFFAALGIRLLHWSDLHAEIQSGKVLLTNLAASYEREAHRMLKEGSILFPREAVDASDARMIIHPPGYSILIRFINGDDTSEDARSRLRWLQALCDSGAAVLIFLIAAQLLPLGAAAASASLVTLSPHLAYYSLWLSPDSLSALPILIAVYLIIRAGKEPRLITIVFAGALVGLSCWMRSNALLLAPFLAVVILLAFERGRRLRYAAALIGAMLAVISPITIRNWIAYRQFIPLSLGSGITLVEGIADYDEEGRFGMPRLDGDVKLKDAEWHNRADYANNIWSPDGVERDRERVARGFAVIRSHPAWFFGVMARRAAFMLRYNDSGSREWPFNTSQVPIVSAEPEFGHNLAVAEGTQPAWSTSPAEFFAQGKLIASGAESSLEADGESLQIVGDNSAFGDQFASAPVAVKKNTDYVLKLSARLGQGNMAVRVTDAERRIALASAILRNEKKDKRKKQKDSEADESDIDSSQSAGAIELPFASGDRDGARIVVSNDGRSDERGLVELGEAQLFEVGPTPHQWTRIMRFPVRAVQKNIFVTSRLLPLIVIGVALLIVARRKKETLWLLAVPLYYFLIQSALHTEYRYTLAIHYFLFIFAAITLYLFGVAVRQGVLLVRSLIRREG